MPTSKNQRADFQFGNNAVRAGTRQTIDFPVSVMPDHTPVQLSVEVIHGRKPGPTVFVSAAVHGDEVIGVEIVRQLLKSRALKNLSGTLLAVPIVNSLGFLNHSRYLPDRRDLNRSFPGSLSGSLASRLARIFMEEIVSKADLGIDIHSAAINRTNLPQIRVSPSNTETLELAETFGAPLTLIAKIRPGSLRDAAQQHGVDILLYEAGEGLRIDEFGVNVGVSGVLRVLQHLKMITGRPPRKKRIETIHSHSSTWLRAPIGGILEVKVSTGKQVNEGDVLGTIADPFATSETDVIAPFGGLVIGQSTMPIINEGDALFHIARIDDNIDATGRIDLLSTQLQEAVVLDEDEIY